MSTMPSQKKLSAKTQTLLIELRQELSETLQFYTAGSQIFPADTPYALCAELADRHLHKLDELLQNHGVMIAKTREPSPVQLPEDLHIACHDALKFALERDRRYKALVTEIDDLDIHQLLGNIEHGIHDRAIPSFKQYLEQHDI